MQTQQSGPPPRDPGRGFLSPPLQPGELGRLAHYRVLKELGRGGMGAVFLAEDVHLGRRVALKVMLPAVAAQDAAKLRFVREAQAVAKLRHDHVVTVYQAGEDNGVPFLAMELLAGKSLDDWLRPDRRATPGQAVTIGNQIARGLAAAHAAGLVHRDIKPANVWLEAPRGRVKLLDFGLARGAGGGDPGLTGTGAILGTPAYMAPEQARGQPLDHRCDLFSLGCVLYRMTTGRTPFPGDTAYAVIMAVASEEPVAPRAVNPEIPPALEDLIRSLLDKDPARRPPTAEAVVAELNRVAAELKESDPRLPAVGGTDVTGALPRPVGRGRRWVVAAALAAVAAVAAVGVSARGCDRTDPDEGESVAGVEPNRPAATRRDPDPPGKPPDPVPEKPAAPSAEGVWEVGAGNKKARFAFLHDRTVVADGYKGRWEQDGWKVTVVGKIKGEKGTWEGDLDADGRTLRLTGPKGSAWTFRRL